MKKIVSLAIMIALLLTCLQSCKQKNKKNDFKWDGIYTGVIPCANCEGIDVMIILSEDNTYQMSYQYIGGNGNTEQYTGTFTWDEEKNIIKFSDETIPHYFKPDENKLIQLDMAGNPITGEHADMYILTKSDYLNDNHNSRNSLDWAGLYSGTIPCANCEGIKVEINLNIDETYQISYLYLGKENNTPEVVSGKFAWNETGNAIILDTKDYPPYYKVGENRLIQLDMDGNPINGEYADMYILAKK
jgi:uncharacterized lipoprotein NlpE involved in copper resistance